MFYSFINFHVVKHMHYMGEVYYICSWICIYRVSLYICSWICIYRFLFDLVVNVPLLIYLENMITSTATNTWT